MIQNVAQLEINNHFDLFIQQQPWKMAHIDSEFLIKNKAFRVSYTSVVKNKNEERQTVILSPWRGRITYKNKSLGIKAGFYHSFKIKDFARAKATFIKAAEKFKTFLLSEVAEGDSYAA